MPRRFVLSVCLNLEKLKWNKKIWKVIFFSPFDLIKVKKKKIERKNAQMSHSVHWWKNFLSKYEGKIKKQFISYDCWWLCGPLISHCAPPPISFPVMIMVSPSLPLVQYSLCMVVTIGKNFPSLFSGTPSFLSWWANNYNPKLVAEGLGCLLRVQY